MGDRVYSQDEKKKLTQLIKEGMTVKQEIADLNEGLKDTVKAIAEEMNVNTKILNKAISVAHKGDLHKHQDDLEELETILVTTNFAN